MIIELADKSKWAKMPDPPFTGEPWIGQDGEEQIIPSIREELLLDAVESASKRLKDLKERIRVLVHRHEVGELASRDLIYGKLLELIE